MERAKITSLDEFVHGQGRSTADITTSLLAVRKKGTRVIGERSYFDRFEMHRSVVVHVKVD
jgi:hypothetical protein